MLAGAPAQGLDIFIGISVSYLIYRTSICKWYKLKSRYSRREKVKYWCGVFACLGMSLGFQQIANELIYATLNNSQINEDKIYKSIHALIDFPLIFWVAAIIITLFMREENIKYTQSENGLSQVRANNFSAEQVQVAQFQFAGKITILILSVVLIIMLIFVAKEKKITDVPMIIAAAMKNYYFDTNEVERLRRENERLRNESVRLAEIAQSLIIQQKNNNLPRRGSIINVIINGELKPCVASSTSSLQSEINSIILTCP